MTPEQLDSVRRTAAVVEQALDQCASCFYDDLFDRNPTTRRLFDDDLVAKRGTLVDELVSLVAATDDLQGFLNRARLLGLHYQRRGIHAADYVFVGEALVAAVAAVIGERWTDVAEASWRRMYALIAEAMLEGAEEGLFSQPDRAEG
jgi:hemoglobin-like flavoprotein